MFLYHLGIVVFTDTLTIQTNMGEIDKTTGV